MSLLLLVPLAPLLTALVLLGWGPKLAGRGAWLSVLAAAASLGSLLFLSGQAPGFSTVWLETGGLSLTLGLSLTPLSWLVALLVAGAGVLVTFYAAGYIADEPDRARFDTALSFFIGAMLTLVLSNSLLLLFVAWEAVGLASYLLIGFWYDRGDARRAALKAFLMTRLGDLGLLLGWVWVLLRLGTTDIDGFLGAVAQGTFPAVELTPVALLFLLGAIGKSAQLPLTAWLPDAMAGPTPVSALIHSATMVAAGVYLLVRLFPLFEAAPGVLAVIFWVGALTALFAALVATTQTDLKRVLAWSTVSQLGEMVLVLGLGGAYAATFHLATHAAFKATLFLAAGAVGHGSRNLRYEADGAARLADASHRSCVQRGRASAGRGAPAVGLLERRGDPGAGRSRPASGRPPDGAPNLPRRGLCQPGGRVDVRFLAGRARAHGARPGLAHVGTLARRDTARAGLGLAAVGPAPAGGPARAVRGRASWAAVDSGCGGRERARPALGRPARPPAGSRPGVGRLS